MNTQEAIDILNTLLDKNRFTDGVEISSLTHAIEHMKRGAPEGWQLVPKEPTHGMASIGACHITSTDYTNDRYYSAKAVYKAMLHATPKPPQERKD